MITAGELMEQTGAAPRQIEYWSRAGIIETVGTPHPRSGYKRHFDEGIVDCVKMLVFLSKAFNGYSPSCLLKKVYENYNKGFVVLDEDRDLVLKWKLKNKENL